MGRISKPLPGAFINRLHPLSEGLVGGWLFNEGAGSQLWDYANPYKNGNHGTLYGTTWAGGREGWAGEFNGTSDYAEVVGLSDTTNFDTVFSISIWIKSKAIGSIGAVASHWTNPGAFNQFAVEVRAGDVKFVTRTSVYRDLFSTIAVNDAIWHHIVVIYNSANNFQGIYIDGGLNNSRAATGTLTTNNTPFIIGALNAGAAFFPGDISNVTVYNRALSAIEISQLCYEPYAMFQQAVNPVAFYVPVVAGNPYYYYQNQMAGAQHA